MLFFRGRPSSWSLCSPPPHQVLHLLLSSAPNNTFVGTARENYISAGSVFRAPVRHAHLQYYDVIMLAMEAVQKLRM